MRLRAAGHSFGTPDVFTFDHYVTVRVKFGRGNYDLKATVSNLGSDTIRLHVKRDCR